MINHPNRSNTDRTIDINVARKVLDVVDAGLVRGVGNPVPGQMCVEAAVCYALGLPHGDDPACVSPALRQLKIRLNDTSWSSNEARGRGLRRLAVAQLGSRNALDDLEFAKRVETLAIRVSVPTALRAVASIHTDPKHQQALRDAANKCESDSTRENALAAKAAAASAADAADASASASAYAASAAASAAADAADAAYASAAYASDADASAAAYAYAAADASAYAAASAADASASASAYAAADAASAAYAAYAAASAAYAADASSAAAYAADASASAAYASAAYAADASASAAASAAADAAADAAYASARDKSLADFAEVVVQILIEMNAPGCQWLSLTEIAA